MKTLIGWIRSASFVLIATFIGAATVNAEVDLLIQNARVVDGTGNPWFVSDVAIDDGRIVAVGRSLEVVADEIIDARERVLAPGFIDVHTHVESSDSREGLKNLPGATTLCSTA